MSFVQKHKAWLLPVLGLGVVWSGWNIVQSLSPTTGAATPVPPRETAVPAPTAVAPAPPPPPSPAAQKPAVSDLWSDLRLLESPAPGLNQVADLVRKGEKSLTPARLEAAPRPDFRPGRWKDLPEPQFPKLAMGADAKPVVTTLPVLDFVLERQDPKQKEAWIGGKPYQEGQTPDGVHRIKHIRNNSVVLVGPTGETLLTTELGKSILNTPKAPTPARSAEAK